jgi:hypothetical protein
LSAAQNNCQILIPSGRQVHTHFAILPGQIDQIPLSIRA